MYDSHTHLNSELMYSQREQYLDLFLKAGGKGLINSGASEFYNIKGIEIAKESPIAKCTLGLHPLECVENHITRENLHQKFQEMVDLYTANKDYVVGIGETGIDVHFPNGVETLDIQKDLFALHCDRAQEHKLPLVVHSRDDFATTIDILQNYKNLIIHFHCRSYDTQEYKTLEAMFPNLFVGFCGNITYKNAQALRDTLSIADPQRILLETDAPYLAPQVVRGQTNHPAYISYIYDFVADQLGMQRSALTQLIENNVKKIYKIDLLG